MKTNRSRICSRAISGLIAVFMLMSMIPQMAFADSEGKSAAAGGIVYISASHDENFVKGTDGTAVANEEVAIEELVAIDLAKYGLEDYLYDANNDGVYEITALHLFIYAHVNIMGLDWSDVRVSGDAGSIFFEEGLFGFSDCNLRYDYNGAYPAVNGWGLTADKIVLSDGDFLNIAHYTSWSFVGDSATGFHYFRDGEEKIQQYFETDDNGRCSLELVRSYSDWTNSGVTAFAAEPDVKVYYGTTYGAATGSVTTTDNGVAEISFSTAGTWYVWCDGLKGLECVDDIVSAPAFATVEVTKTQDQTSEEEQENEEQGNSGEEDDEATKAATLAAALVKPANVSIRLRVASGGYDDVVFSWSKVSGASGYYVYYKKSTSKNYTKLATTTGTSVTKKDLADGVKYYFKVVPYVKVGDQVCSASAYKTSSIYTLKKITTPKVKRSGSKVKVSWTNIGGESGYQISKSTKKKGTKIVATYKTTSGKSKVIKATKGKKYYYKVRAYKSVKVGNKYYRVYGPWSSVKAYRR